MSANFLDSSVVGALVSKMTSFLKDQDQLKKTMQEMSVEQLLKFLQQQDELLGQAMFRRSQEWPANDQISGFVSANKDLCQSALNLASSALDLASSAIKYLPEKYQAGAKELVGEARETLKDCQKVVNDPSNMENIDQAKKSIDATRDHGVKMVNDVVDEVIKIAPAMIKGAFDSDAGTRFDKSSSESVADSIAYETGCSKSKGSGGSTNLGSLKMDRDCTITASPKDLDSAMQAGSIASHGNGISVTCPDGMEKSVAEKAEHAGITVTAIKTSSQIAAETKAETVAPSSPAATETVDLAPAANSPASPSPSGPGRR